jgi:ATP-dependent Clp protease ATP-binding subunit ClpC
MDYAAVWSLLQCFLPDFTDRAVKLLSVARDEAEARHHALVTPEHVLLALVAIEPGVGRVALERLGFDFQREKQAIVALVVGAPPGSPNRGQSFSEEVKRMIVLAAAASKELGHEYVGTEHLIVGLLRCGPCPAGDYLRQFGITVDRFREEAMRLLGQNR